MAGRRAGTSGLNPTPAAEETHRENLAMETLQEAEEEAAKRDWKGQTS